MAVSTMKSSRALPVKLVENFHLVWLDKHYNEKINDYGKCITKLRQIVRIVNIFTDVDECIDFVTDMRNEMTLMIISREFSSTLIPIVQDISEVNFVFIFGQNKINNQHSTNDRSLKMKGIFTDITRMCEELKLTIQECEQNGISFNLMPTNEDVSKKTLDQLEPTFMYSEIVKEIILEIEFNEEHFKEFINYCKNTLTDDNLQLNTINNIQRTYHSQTPIWWYTRSSIFYSMLNRALRLMDLEVIIKMGFYISVLHRDVEELYKKQYSGKDNQQSFKVYRGQSMSRQDFEQIMKTKGGLIAFNNFLSTSKDRDVSLFFAESNQVSSNFVAIFFDITVDPLQSTTPFACIKDISSFGDEEEEILFSMHAIFRIGNIVSIGKTPDLYQIELTLTRDNDIDLRILMNRIRDEIHSSSHGWPGLGLLLLKMGQPKKAEEVYRITLEPETKHSQKAAIYNQLGLSKTALGEYREATALYEEAIQILEATRPTHDFNLGQIYHNMGVVYYRMSHYSKALSYYEKGLEIQKQFFPSNHPQLAITYNNIGLVYFNTADYIKAISFHKQAMEIQKQMLPAQHPDLAMSCVNLGNVFSAIGDYSKALDFHEKDLEINKRSLPPNHPSLAISYNNIGLIYDKMDQYSKALSFYEKALQIQQQSLPSDHPDLAMSYSNIGGIYYSMRNYSKALSYYEKDLEITRKIFHSNHPSLGSAYGNIGLAYDGMRDYSKALSFYEKALKIQQQSLPSNHPTLGISYCNIGVTYEKKRNYSKARFFYEKTVENAQHSLPINHRTLESRLKNLNRVKNKL